MKKLTKEQVASLDRVVKDASRGSIDSADTLVKMAQSGSRVAKSLALEAFDNISNKIIQQRITNSTLSSMYTVWRQFQDSPLLGNGKEFVKILPQGMAYPTDAGSANYVPNKRYDRKPITQTIQTPTKKQFKLTMTGEELLSKVVSKEKMMEIISTIVNTFEYEIDLYMTDIMYKLLSTQTFSKTIVDTESTSAYYCARRIAYELKQASSFRPDFVIDQTTYDKAYDCWKKEDVILFFNPKTMVNFDVGISPVLFNPEKTGFNSLGVNQVIEMPATQYNNTYEEGQREEPEFTPTPYIEDTSMLAISKTSIALLPQLKQMATQRFINNMTDLYTYDFWYVAAIVGFTLGFKYSCDNLNKTPEESDVQ